MLLLSLNHLEWNQNIMHGSAISVIFQNHLVMLLVKIFLFIHLMVSLIIIFHNDSFSQIGQVFLHFFIYFLEVAAATPNFLAMGKEESNKNLNVISENHFNSVKTVLEKCKK